MMAVNVAARAFYERVRFAAGGAQAHHPEITGDDQTADGVKIRMVR